MFENKTICFGDNRKNPNEAVSRHGPVQGAEDEIGYCLDLQTT